MDAATFGEGLLDQARLALGSLPVDAGLTATEIDLAERTLPVPGALRVFWERVGNLKEVTTSYHQFYPPAGLQLRGGAVVFCKERSGRILWGVETSQLRVWDPPVLQAGSQDTAWMEEASSMCVFLTNMTCWQLLNSMPVIGRFESSLTALKRMKKQWSVLSATMKFHMASLLEPKAGILATVLYDSERAYLGGRTEGALEESARSLGVRLEWVRRGKDGDGTRT